MNRFEKPTTPSGTKTPGLETPETYGLENIRAIEETIKNNPNFRNQLKVWIRKAENQIPSPSKRVYDQWAKDETGEEIKGTETVQ